MPSNQRLVFTGKLQRSDIGMGGWILKQRNGSNIDLYGPIPKEMVDQSVIVKGERISIGVGMGGEAVKVISITIVQP